MENRFGVKDFFIFAFLVVLIAMVGLAMFQFDRQWRVVQEIQTSNAQLADDIHRLQRKVDSGIVVAGGSGGTRGSGGEGQKDPFYQILKAEEEPDFARGGWYIDNFGIKIGRLTPLVSSDVYQTWIE